MKKNYKISAETSRHYLYVKFLPAYGTDFTYNSDDRHSEAKGKADLIRRVLNGSVANRYEYAKLVDRKMGKRVLGVWIPPYGQMTWESYQRFLNQKSELGLEQPILKASVAFKPTYRAFRERLALPPLLTLIGQHKRDGRAGEDIALLSIIEQVLYGQYSKYYRQVFTYQQDRKVATFSESGLTFHCKKLEHKVILSGNESLFNIINKNYQYAV